MTSKSSIAKTESTDAPAGSFSNNPQAYKMSSGLYWNPCGKFQKGDPLPTINDMALGLASIQRWGGQRRGAISVATHSMLFALQVLRHHLAAPALILTALLHDVAEGLGLGDIPGPVKHGASNFAVAYRKAEGRVLKMISSRFHLTQPLPCWARKIHASLTNDEAAACENDGDGNPWPDTPLFRDPHYLASSWAVWVSAMSGQSKGGFYDMQGHEVLRP